MGTHYLAVFAGKDASRALAQSSLKAEECRPEWEDLSDEHKKVLNDWYTFFSKRYNIKGKVEGLIGADPLALDGPRSTALMVGIITCKMTVLDQAAACMTTIEVDDLVLFSASINEGPTKALSSQNLRSRYAEMGSGLHVGLETKEVVSRKTLTWWCWNLADVLYTTHGKLKMQAP
nr:putative steroid-binding protein 3 [Quercus suber]